MKVFLDCGYYAGKALEYYAPLMDESWTVYAFEPNPNINADETIKRFPFKVNLIKKAVWTDDTELKFRVTSREDASHLSEVRTSQDEEITVEALDFSKFVAGLPEDATIICSMDIEGSEYPVLRKMLKESTVQRISLLDIEFHDRLLLEEDAATSSLLRRTLESEGVLVKLKI